MGEGEAEKVESCLGTDMLAYVYKWLGLQGEEQLSSIAFGSFQGRNTLTVTDFQYNVISQSLEWGRDAQNQLT